jgi:hypothetical protein
MVSAFATPRTPSDLVLICTCDGQQWWQRRVYAKTHISSLFTGPEVVTGDMLMEVDEEDRLIGRPITIKQGKVAFGVPRVMEIHGYQNEIFERTITRKTGRLSTRARPLKKKASAARLIAAMEAK